MLKTRILTASILLPLVLWLVMFSSYSIFCYVTTGIIILAAYEWLKLLLKKKLEISGCLLIFVSILIGCIYNCNLEIKFNCVVFSSYLFAICIINIIFWGLASLLIIKYSLGTTKFHAFCLNYPMIWKTFSLSSCFVVLIPSWLSINYLKHHNIYYLLQVIFMIVVIDCGGYLGGKLLGKHKLSMVSPNKTWEGVLIGYLFSVLLFIINFFIFIILTKSKFVLHATLKNLFIILIMHLVIALSIIGDLFESLLKRIAKVKDSGRILPGHGGILDRLDSILAVMPLAVLIYQFIIYSTFMD